MGNPVMKRGSRRRPKRPQTEAQRRAFLHNRLIGHCCMMKKQCEDMVLADTTTFAQEELARKIRDLAIELENSLRTERVEGPSPTSSTPQWELKL